MADELQGWVMADEQWGWVMALLYLALLQQIRLLVGKQEHRRTATRGHC